MEHQSKSLEMTRAHVFISGKVQGVGYRFYTLEKALKMSVNGTVKNLSDGRVEAIFEGSKESVEKMIKWCEQGPTYAVVKDVKVEYEKPEGIKGFEIIRY
ncbi:MAG: acylphosphatase [Microcoleaceae cyanobacterium MO_207.B10]|nr:acylphosphatase [Microcoleaceae cyanobacterium MO_207.B10]